jgi:hypothetical protein
LRAIDDHVGDGELTGQRLTLRFPIDGAGEAIAFLVGRIGAGIVDDQVGEAAARMFTRRIVALLLVEIALRRRGGDSVGDDWSLGIEAAIRSRRIGRVVEAERFGGKAAAFMVGLGDRRGGARPLGDRGAGEAASHAKHKGCRGQGRGAGGASH